MNDAQLAASVLALLDGTADTFLVCAGAGAVVSQKTAAEVRTLLGVVGGPASATDNAVARYDLTTGKLIQNSAAILTDTGGLSGLDSISVVPPDSSKSVMLHRNNTQGVSIGLEAGVDQSDAVCIGYEAGFQSTIAGQNNSVLIGRHAGFQAIAGNSVCIGHAAGQYARSGGASVLIGYEAGRNSGQLATFNNFSSVIIGHNAGRQAYASNTAVLIGENAGANVDGVTSTGVGGVVIGYGAASASTAHRDAVILGLNAGQNASASYSVLVGSLAGKNTTGIYNVMIGYAAGQDLTGGNKLVIECNETYAPAGVNGLIYGEFDNRLLRFGADTVKLQKDLILETAQTPASAGATGTTGMIKRDANYIYVCTASNTWKRAELAWRGYVLPTPDGTSGQVLVTDGAGTVSWQTNSAGGNSFSTIAVSGQSDVVADSATDTLTLVAGSNITITTNAGSDTITIAAASPTIAIGGSITSATAGSILFAGVAGVLAQDNAKLFWDDTNDRLGVGTTSPGAQVHSVAASSTSIAMIAKAAASTTVSYQEWQNSAGTVMAKIDRYGAIYGLNGLYVTVGGTEIFDAGYNYGGVQISQPATVTKACVIKGIASRTAPLLQLQSSAGVAVGNVGGTVFTNFTDTSTTSVDGTEDDLHSNNIAANTLAINGDSLQQTEHLQLVAHATATRRVRKYFAGTQIFDSGTLTLSLGADLAIETTIIRESSSIIRATVRVITTSATAIPPVTYTRITGLTLSGTNFLKTTGVATGTGSASGDIVDKFSRVQALPAG